MKSKMLTALALLMVCVSFAENAISIAIAPTWPSKNTFIKNADKKAMWDTEISWGISFDDRITIGAQADFMWHIEKFTEAQANDEPDVIKSKTKNIAFPISGFIALSPIPQYKLHPVIKVQAGYNSVVVKHTDYDNADQAEVDKHDGYYNGFLARFGADAVYDLGKQSSIFTGFHYQISTVSKDNRELDMNAPMLKIGLSVYY